MLTLWILVLTMTWNNIDEIVSALEAKTAPTDAPILIHDRIVDHLVFHDQIDRASASEQAEKLIDSVSKRILERQDAAQSAGSVWAIEVYGTEGEYVRGSSFADTSLPSEEQDVRARRQHVNAITDTLRALTPNEFERVCTAILQEMGCKETVTTPHSNDGGIDFYGRLQLVGRLDQKFPYGGIDNRVKIWMIGQAKRFNVDNLVQAADIRELVGSVELARTGGAIHNWEGLDLHPFDAVLQVFFTTGSYTSGATKLLE